MVSYRIVVTIDVHTSIVVSSYCLLFQLNLFLCQNCGFFLGSFHEEFAESVPCADACSVVLCGDRAVSQKWIVRSTAIQYIMSPCAENLLISDRNNSFAWVFQIHLSFKDQVSSYMAAVLSRAWENLFLWPLFLKPEWNGGLIHKISGSCKSL